MGERDADGSYPWLRRVRPYVLPAAGLLVVGGGLALGLTAGIGPRGKVDDEWATKLLDVPAVAPAPAVRAESARLQPDARVIGVSIGGHRRAYLIEAMSQSHSHVINDLLGGRPVTVAYCDRTHCTRAFTVPDRVTPLELAVGGWFNADGVRDMLVRVGPYRYLLKTGRGLDGDSPAFPYESVEVELSTWREWRIAHPNTDVYLGGVRKM